MKIVHVMNWYIPHMGYQENFLPSEQKNLGHDVDIITSDRAPYFHGFAQHIGKHVGGRIIGSGVFEDNGVRIHRLKSRIEFRSRGEVVLKGLRTTLHALQPDVIQCHGAVCATTLQAIVHSTSMDCRVFVDDHLNSDNCAQQSIWNRLYMRFIRAFYRHYQSEVRCWMPVTYASRHMLASILHPPYNAVLFPLGVNTELFSVSPAERASGRALLQVADDDLLLVSAGKFDKNKKIDLLIDALHVLRKEFSTIRLLLIGGGTEAYLHTIRKRVHAYGLEGSVLFVDFVKNMDLNRYYNAADIGIWPGTASITVLEAIAAGLPVIIPASDTSYGILFDHTCALGFQKDDAASLTEAIRRLIVDTALKNSLRSNGQTATETTLSWKKIALQSIDIYNSY